MINNFSFSPHFAENPGATTNRPFENPGNSENTELKLLLPFGLFRKL